MNACPALFFVINGPDQWECQGDVNRGMAANVALDTQARADEAAVAEGTAAPDAAAVEEDIGAGLLFC